MTNSHDNDQMRPAVITCDGFLGTDDRPVEEIIRADDGTVKKIGLTHRAIAERMEYFSREAKKGLGEFVRLEPHFEAACEMARGFLSCPFGEPGKHRKAVVTLRNLRQKKEVIFSGLNVHLIAEHGFYEGKGSCFRLDPEELAKVLEIGG